MGYLAQHTCCIPKASPHCRNALIQMYWHRNELSFSQCIVPGGAPELNPPNMICVCNSINCCTSHHQSYSPACSPSVGQVAGASPTQLQHMYQQLSVLTNLTESFVHRIGPEQLFKDLPAKHENVVLLCLDTAQQAMYKAYLEVWPESQDGFK